MIWITNSFVVIDGQIAWYSRDELFGKSEDSSTLRTEDAVLAGELTDSISY